MCVVLDECFRSELLGLCPAGLDRINEIFSGFTWVDTSILNHGTHGLHGRLRRLILQVFTAKGSEMREVDMVWMIGPIGLLSPMNSKNLPNRCILKSILAKLERRVGGGFRG